MECIAFGDLNASSKDFLHVCGEVIASITTVCQHIFYMRQTGFMEAERFQRSCAVADSRVIPDPSLPPSSPFASAVSVFLTL